MSGGFFDFSDAIQSSDAPPPPAESSSVMNDEESFQPTDVTTDCKFENYEVDFSFNDEGYTLVNILKNYLVNMDEVLFVGRRQHHPLSTTTNLRIILDGQWVDDEHNSSIDQAMVDVLRRATRKAAQDTVHLRNSLPNIEVRVVEFDEQDGSVSGDNDVGVHNPFQTLFSAQDFTF
jgi:DNA-directed RNA polymerase subunit L